MTGFKVNHNSGALQTARALGRHSDAVQRALERLSSGLRINRAADDAASLAIAADLTFTARLQTRALLNVNDGLSMLAVAQGALEELKNIILRQKELAAQAANGTYTGAQRLALDREANALSDEFNRIVAGAEFNGMQLFHDPDRETSLQVGWGGGTSDSIAFRIGSELARTIGNGTFAAMTSYVAGSAPAAVASGDLNGDGITDLVTAFSGAEKGFNVLLGTGGGTFTSDATVVIGTSPSSIALRDLDSDGALDALTIHAGSDRAYVMMGNGNGTFQAVRFYAAGDSPEAMQFGDFNNDGKTDVAAASRIDGKINILLGNGNGTFNALTSFSGGVTYNISGGDFNGDGQADLVFSDYFETVSVLLGNGNGTFKAEATYAAGSRSFGVAVSDFNHDGIYDLALAGRGLFAAPDSTVSILIGNGDGTFRAYTRYEAGPGPESIQAGDINGDGLSDLVVTNYGASGAGSTVSVLLGRGDGTFAPGVSYAVGVTPTNLILDDLNGDGVADLALSGGGAGAPSTRVLLANTVRSSTVPHLDLTTAAGAQAALEGISETLERVSAELAATGALQRRLEHTVSYLNVMRENYAAAAGRIMDADFASEVAELLRRQVLQQAATAVLAHALNDPRRVLDLLL